MAAEEEVDAGEEAETAPETAGAGAALEQGKDLERVTDRVETEKSVSNTHGSRVQEALAELLAGERERAQSAQARERELAAMKCAPGDVDLIALELELEKKAAERLLREHGGDVSAALQAALGPLVL